MSILSLDNELEILQQVVRLAPAPLGPRLINVVGTLRASLPRLEKDLPPLIDFLNDLLPVVRKHWQVVGPAINDLLPILEKIIAQLDGTA